jgi:serine/threonine protein kinase
MNLIRRRFAPKIHTIESAPTPIQDTTLSPLHSTSKITRTDEKKVIRLRDRNAKPSPIILEYDKRRNENRDEDKVNGGSKRPVAMDLIDSGACSKVRRVRDTSTGIYYADSISTPEIQYGIKMIPLCSKFSTKDSKTKKHYSNQQKIIDQSTNIHFISLKMLLKMRQADERFVNIPRIVFMEPKRKTQQVGSEEKFLFARRKHVISDLGIHNLSLFVPDNPAHAMLIAKHLIAAVLHLHENHIIHRDIKPKNIICFKDTLPKLIDFNLAIDFSDTPTPITSTAGTRFFMAPELRVKSDQNKKRNFEELVKTDGWSLGATLFNLFTSTPSNPQGNKLWNNASANGQQIYYRNAVNVENERNYLDGALKRIPAPLIAIQITLLRGLLEPVPSLRMTLETALLEIESYQNPDK